MMILGKFSCIITHIHTHTLCDKDGGGGLGRKAEESLWITGTCRQSTLVGVIILRDTIWWCSPHTRPETGIKTTFKLLLTVSSGPVRHSFVLDLWIKTLPFGLCPLKTMCCSIYKQLQSLKPWTRAALYHKLGTLAESFCFCYYHYFMLSLSIRRTVLAGTRGHDCVWTSSFPGPSCWILCPPSPGIPRLPSF